jgi:uncharacterized repeat protein (TIGR03847 family)
MSASFDLPEPGRVSIGAVGEPGARTFYMQARQGDRVVTLKLEKQQVAALCELLTELLADLAAPGPLPVDGGIEEPALADWVVGGVQLSFDPATDRVVMLVEEAPNASAATGDDEGAIGRLSFTREQAAAMVETGEELVQSGRPTCPLCGHPMDPGGHSCPKTNGHRAPAP